MSHCVHAFMYDTFEEYTHEVLNGLNGGYVHGMQVGPYVARPCYLGIMDYDSFESYTNSAVLNGLYIPEWTDPFIDRVNHLGMIAYDTFEAYSNGADLIGLNLGWSSVYGGWEAPYSEQASVEALAWDGLQDYDLDDGGTYAGGPATLNGGTGWGGAWVAHFSNVGLLPFVTDCSVIALRVQDVGLARAISLPSGWTKIRLGLRLHFSYDTTSFNSCYLIMGFCHGTGTQWFSDYRSSTTCANFAGMIVGLNGAQNWAYGAGPPPYYQMWGGNQLEPVTNVAGTPSFGNSLNGGANFFLSAGWYDSLEEGFPRRSVLYFDLTKGSPNYTFSVPCFPATIGEALIDFTPDEFLYHLGEQSPGGYSGVGTPQTMAFSEVTHGALDSVCLYWNNVDQHFPHLFDVAVAVLA